VETCKSGDLFCLTAAGSKTVGDIARLYGLHIEKEVVLMHGASYTEEETQIKDIWTSSNGIVAFWSFVIPDGTALNDSPRLSTPQLPTIPRHTRLKRKSGELISRLEDSSPQKRIKIEEERAYLSPPNSSPISLSQVQPLAKEKLRPQPEVPAPKIPRKLHLRTLRLQRKYPLDTFAPFRAPGKGNWYFLCKDCDRLMTIYGFVFEDHLESDVLHRQKVEEGLSKRSNLRRLSDDKLAVKQHKCELVLPKKIQDRVWNLHVSFPDDRFLAMHGRSSDKVVIVECLEKECVQGCLQLLDGEGGTVKFEKHLESTFHRRVVQRRVECEEIEKELELEGNLPPRRKSGKEFKREGHGARTEDSIPNKGPV
jgi:hypothetical protein